MRKTRGRPGSKDIEQRDSSDVADDHGSIAAIAYAFPLLIGGPIFGILVLVLTCIDQVKDLNYGRDVETAEVLAPE